MHSAAVEVQKLDVPGLVVKNPLDLVGAQIRHKPEVISDLVSVFRGCGAYDLVIYVVSFAALMTRALKQITASPSPPLSTVVSSVSIEESVPSDARAHARAGTAAITLGLNSCLRAVSTVCSYTSFRERWLAIGRRDHLSSQTTPVRAAIPCTGEILDDYATQALLSHWGIPLAETIEAESEDAAVAAAAVLGYPVVLKATARTGIAHKTDHGMTHLDLRRQDEVRHAYRALVKALGHREKQPSQCVAMQHFVRGGVEVFVGGSNRDAVGSVVAVGSGGTNVELIRDVAFGIAPLSDFDVLEMIRALRSRSMFLGSARRARPDLDALTNIVRTVGDLLIAHRDVIVDIDLNPVILFPSRPGATVVDALVTTADAAPKGKSRFAFSTVASDNASR